MQNCAVPDGLEPVTQGVQKFSGLHCCLQLFANYCRISNLSRNSSVSDWWPDAISMNGMYTLSCHANGWGLHVYTNGLE